MQLDPLMTLAPGGGALSAGKGTVPGGAAIDDGGSLFARELGLAIEPLRAAALLPSTADGTLRATAGKTGMAPDPGETAFWLPETACSAGETVVAGCDAELPESATPSPDASDNLVVPWLDLGVGLVGGARLRLPDGSAPAADDNPASAAAAGDTGREAGTTALLAGALATTGHAGAPGAATHPAWSAAWTRRSDGSGHKAEPAPAGTARREDRRGRADLTADEAPPAAGTAVVRDDALPRADTTRPRDAAETPTRGTDHDLAADAGASETPKAGDAARHEAAPVASAPPPVADLPPNPAAGAPATVAGADSAAAPADAAAAELQLPVPFGTPEFMPRLGAELTVLARDGVQHARVHINPAEMGPIAVQLTLDGQQAQVSLVADNAATRQLLEQQMPSLAAALRENGLTLTGGGVFEQPRQAREQGDGQRSRPGTAAAGRTGDGDGTVERAATPARTLRRQGVVDLYA